MNQLVVLVSFFSLPFFGNSFANAVLKNFLFTEKYFSVNYYMIHGLSSCIKISQFIKFCLHKYLYRNQGIGKEESTS